MWNKHLMIIVFCAWVTTLFTSCLRDIENVYDPGPTAAVVRIHGDSARRMANTRFGWIYDQKLSSYSDGKCLLLRFEYDPKADGNESAEKRGYYTVHVSGDMKVDQKDASAERTNPGELLPNEQSIPFAINPSDKDYYIYLENYLFIPSICLTTRSQVLDWTLTYDPHQRPIVEDRKSIYALFLHAVAKTGPLEGAEVEPIPAVNAFNLSKFVEAMRLQGGRDADMYVQIHYVDQIYPQDSTQFTRNVTEPLPLKTTK